MLQLVDSDSRKVYLDVVNPLLAQRLAGMMELGDFSAQVRATAAVAAYFVPGIQYGGVEVHAKVQVITKVNIKVSS